MSSIDPFHAETLRRNLEQFTPIPAEEWAFFASLLRTRALEAGDYFVQAGDETREIGFLLSGIFRKFYRDAKGSEFIKEFCVGGGFISPYSAYLLKEPCQINFQALENSILLCIHCSELEILYARHVCWQICGRKVAEIQFVERERREYELLMLSASERYDTFLERFPKLKERVPQYLLASYLGITPVALSRILSRRNGTASFN